MMYFSRMKTTLILGVCLLGMLLGVPNLFSAPAAWLPWRTVHLGLDLRGGSYLLLEVDMKAVLKERLDSLTDSVRQALRGGQIFYQTLEAQPDQNRVLLRLRDATKTDAAVGGTEAADQPRSVNRAAGHGDRIDPGWHHHLDPVGARRSRPGRPARWISRSRSSAGESTRPAWWIRRSPARGRAASSCSFPAWVIRTASSS